MTTPEGVPIIALIVCIDIVYSEAVYIEIVADGKYQHRPVFQLHDKTGHLRTKSVYF